MINKTKEYSLFWDRFKSNRRNLYSLYIFSFIFILSLFAEVISNDKPIMMSIDDKIYKNIFVYRLASPAQTALYEPSILFTDIYNYFRDDLDINVDSSMFALKSDRRWAPYYIESRHYLVPLAISIFETLVPKSAYH